MCLCLCPQVWVKAGTSRYLISSHLPSPTSFCMMMMMMMMGECLFRRRSRLPSPWFRNNLRLGRIDQPTNQTIQPTDRPPDRPIFQESIQGQTLKAMQGPRTDPSVLAALKREIQRGRPTSSLLLNYKRDGTMFLNYLRVYPLIGDARGTITHFLGVLQVCHVCGVLFVGSTYCCGVFGLSGVLKNVFLLFFVTFRFFVEIGVCCSDCACRLVFPVTNPALLKQASTEKKRIGWKQEMRSDRTEASPASRFSAV